MRAPSPRAPAWAAAFGRLLLQPDPEPRLPSWQVRVANVQADEFGRPEAGAEGQGDQRRLPRAVLDHIEE